MNFKRINIILIVVLIALNIAFYPFLPEEIIMQINATGRHRYMAKELGLLVIPAITIFLTFRGSSEDKGDARILILNGFLFVVNLVANIINLK